MIVMNKPVRRVRGARRHSRHPCDAAVLNAVQNSEDVSFFRVTAYCAAAKTHSRLLLVLEMRAQKLLLRATTESRQGGGKWY